MSENEKIIRVVEQMLLKFESDKNIRSVSLKWETHTMLEDIVLTPVINVVRNDDGAKGNILYQQLQQYLEAEAEKREADRVRNLPIDY